MVVEGAHETIANSHDSAVSSSITVEALQTLWHFMVFAGLPSTAWVLVRAPASNITVAGQRSVVTNSYYKQISLMTQHGTCRCLALHGCLGKRQIATSNPQDSAAL